MKSEQVIVLKDEQEKAPEGYIKMSVNDPPHKGHYAIMPKHGCSDCNERGMQQIRVAGNIKGERPCSCVTRRLRRHLGVDAKPGMGGSPTVKTKAKAPKSPSKGEQHAARSLQSRVDELTKSVTAREAKLAELEAGRDAELIALRRDRDDAQHQIDTLEQQRSNIHEQSNKFREAAVEVVRLAEQQATEMKQQAAVLDEQALDISKAIRNIDHQRLADNVERAEKRWADQIASLMNGKARSEARKLDKLRGRLERKLERSQTGELNQLTLPGMA